MSTENSTLYDVRCGKVLSLKVNITAGDYDMNDLMGLIETDAKSCPDIQVPVDVFNTLVTTFDTARAFGAARNQVAAYRIWLAQHTEKADALARDLI